MQTVSQARLFDNEDDFKRMDFPLSDVSSTATWVKEARKVNQPPCMLNVPP